MKKDLQKTRYGLCFRCEHRAEYLHDKLNASENDFVKRPNADECSQTDRRCIRVICTGPGATVHFECENG